MREVNFSIPNVNKASVGITTALYDRRALDCTSTLPLINSLNHLAYLTTSSARIRDILTIDGGIERLTCILKQGRKHDPTEMWKWNLAFQCVVNIGVRGSEVVRTRVVEADMVPVIATILSNYILIIDKCREKADSAHSSRRRGPFGRGEHAIGPNDARNDPNHSQIPDTVLLPGNATTAARQNHSEAIRVPNTTSHANNQGTLGSSAIAASSSANQQYSGISGTQRQRGPLGTPHHHHIQRHRLHSHDQRNSIIASDLGASIRSMPLHPTIVGARSGTLETGRDRAINRPYHDSNHLPLMMPSIQSGASTSQPNSPRTPGAPSIQSILRSNDTRRHTSRQHYSSSESDETHAEREIATATLSLQDRDEAMVDMATTVNIQVTDHQSELLEEVSLTNTIPAEPQSQDAETFNITHQSNIDGSILDANVVPNNNELTFVPPTQAIAVVNIVAQTRQHSQARQILEHSAPPKMLADAPRDEDVLMSLQLLAYVSKYCNLRSYFQNTHLVPRLEVQKGVHINSTNIVEVENGLDEEVEEFLLPDDVNIFPLVEQFTVRHHSHDMQHWAGVVMRNLCRKDDTRGGIRQCAYYQCGRWEESARQFAKCRRCRRTKYCSKECQKNAWVFHRHWCQVASP